jgi:hypothetical protein
MPVHNLASLQQLVHVLAANDDRPPPPPRRPAAPALTS